MSTVRLHGNRKVNKFQLPGVVQVQCSIFNTVEANCTNEILNMKNMSLSTV